MISAEVVPVAGEEVNLARKLQDRGFRVLSRDGTISVDGSQALWETVFGVQFTDQSRPAAPGLSDSTQTYQKVVQSTLVPPPDLKSLIDDVLFIEPPELF